MTREFQVGDRVRLTGTQWRKEYHGVQAGDIVVIDQTQDFYGSAIFLVGGENWYVYNADEDYWDSWGGELVEGAEVGEMTRLPRERKGKTPIDVGMVQQDGLTRVRISMGEDGGSRKNSDLSIQETEDLIAMLNYHMLVAKGEIPNG